MNKKYAGLDFPAWFDGKDVNEAAFCREFLSKNKLIYTDNAFFTPDGRLTDPLLLKEKIYAELECCAAKNILRTISNIVEIMKPVVHAESFPPNPDEIHVQNGTLRIDGSFLAGRTRKSPRRKSTVLWQRSWHSTALSAAAMITELRSMIAVGCCSFETHRQNISRIKSETLLFSRVSDLQLQNY